MLHTYLHEQVVEHGDELLMDDGPKSKASKIESEMHTHVLSPNENRNVILNILGLNNLG